MGKPWLLWTHDPCPEGGWRLAGEFDTQEEAVQAARETHKREAEQHRGTVEHGLEENRTFKSIWTHDMNCYDKCIVTGGEVFRMENGEAELKEDVALIRKMVLGFFNGNEAKTDLWFESANPLLGGISPNQMVKADRTLRLAHFVEQQLAENELPEKQGG